MNTTGYGGRTLKKSAVVYTNDPANKEVKLDVQGDVESFATISPAQLRLYGTIGEKIYGNVVILPSEKYPFKILDVKAENGQYINYSLEEDPKGNSKGYILTVENLLEQKGRYLDTLQIKTDSKIRPVFTVKIYGNILEKTDEVKKGKPIQNN